MSQDTHPDLGIKDIRFLKAVRDINEAPEQYPETGGGKQPATKTALREATSLSDDAIRYRFENGAKITTDGRYGLVEILSPKIKDNGGFGPKSAELTEKGAEVLDAELDDRDLLVGGVSPGQSDADGELEATVATLQEQVTTLEAKVSELQTRLEAHEESPTGALNEKEQRAFEALADGLPAHNQVLKALGVSPGQVGSAEEIDAEEVRQRVRQAIANAGEGQSEADGAGGVSDETQEPAADGDGDQTDFGSLRADSE